MAEQKMLAAAKAGDTARLRMALANGANVNATDDNGATALYHASSMGYAACVKLLLAAGGHVAVVDLLLKRGALHVKGMAAAAYHGHRSIVNMLLWRGVDPNAGIDAATEGGQMQIVKLLLDKGATPRWCVGCESA